MKRQNKYIAFFLVLFLSLSPVSAFADEIENPTHVCITSGLDLSAEGRETTFDRCRLVYGEAAPETTIDVSVSRTDGVGDRVEEYQESLVVGSLGIFSLNIPLEMGTNYITLTASAEGYDTISYEVQVKRYSQQVKRELQTMVALPGANGAGR